MDSFVTLMSRLLLELVPEVLSSLPKTSVLWDTSAPRVLNQPLRVLLEPSPVSQEILTSRIAQSAELVNSVNIVA